MGNKKSSKTPATGSNVKSNSSSGAKPKRAVKKSSSGTKSMEHKTRFPIAGIGASAGGLEAFTELLKHLPADTGMAYVLIQHLHPDYPSALTEILSRATRMPVLEVTDGMTVETNHVYVIPPNTYLGILHGVLHLMPRGDISGQNLPIDYFFRHLAEDMGSMAIGVILSGTASDGVLGLKAIGAEGGITIAQEEVSAKYDGMPHSAIAAGCVDLIMPPNKIAVELARIAKHPYVVPKPSAVPMEASPVGEDMLNKIFLLLRRQTGNDFTYYKPTTIQRRIRRRMLLHKLEKMPDYLRYLQGNPAEIEQLFHDILINVTGFFRDPDTFEFLAHKVFPSFKNLVADSPLRIWVPGCSSGEEAYSLAIVLLECLGESTGNITIQIFATDIDETAIEKARAGIYPDNIRQDVSPERLRRFFVKMEGGGYQISKYIRDLCVFAVQNVAKDPPFSRIDLVSCRNLLIYMGPVLQKKIMSIFHYALKPGGYLMLGSAESVGGFTDLYRVVDAKEKVYAKKSLASPIRLEFDTPERNLQAIIPEEETGSAAGLSDRFDLSREVDHLLITHFTPAGVAINDTMGILQFRGRTGAYLEPPPGEANLNLLKMVREDLLLDLNRMVRQALSSNEKVRKAGIKIERGGKQRVINIEVLPIKPHFTTERYFLVVFDDVTPADGLPPSPPETIKNESTNMHVTELEQELAATKEYLQSVIEQQETSNEELRSANEEIQSSNEELQSINEELETAKEELQSTNEELSTVNDELESRNVELNQVNSDLSNLILSINIPLVILGIDQRVRRFSPKAEKILNLISGDIGRPFSDIKATISVDGLKDIINQVIDTLIPAELETQDDDGHWYSIRVHPYKSYENKIDGVVVVYVNVDEMKRNLDEARFARNFAQSIVASLRYPIMVLDHKLSVVSASTAFFETFKVTKKDTIGNLLYRLGNGQWGIPELRSKLEDTIQSGVQFENFIVEHKFENIGQKTMKVSGRQIKESDNSDAMVLMQIEEIPE